MSATVRTRLGRRTPIACERCHRLKAKCTGERPICGNCRNARSSNCRYPTRDRRVQVFESKISALEDEIRILREACGKKNGSTMANLSSERNSENTVRVSLTKDDEEIPNLLIDAEALSQVTDSNALHYGSASGSVFNKLLRKEISEKTTEVVSDEELTDHDFLMPKHTSQSSASPSEIHWTILPKASKIHMMPDRDEAIRLVSCFCAIIGPDYHYFLKSSFMKRVDLVYTNFSSTDPVWLSQMYLIFALGEAYSNDYSVPIPAGYKYYQVARQYLDSLHSKGSVQSLETLNLLVCYLHIIGESDRAYWYSGMSIRMAIALGLNRRPSRLEEYELSPLQREYRKRVFWSVFVSNALADLITGQPHGEAIQNVDIDLPTLEGLSGDEALEFFEPSYFNARIALAQILSEIMRSIYHSKPNKDRMLVSSVSAMLRKLRRWKDDNPKHLTLDSYKRIPSGLVRSVVSLHLLYNELVILTVRPIFFHLFKLFLHSVAEDREQPSSLITSLSNFCVDAARANLSILRYSYNHNYLSLFGYLDAWYAFSAATILAIVAMLGPPTDETAKRRARYDFEEIVKLMNHLFESGNLVVRPLRRDMLDLQILLAKLSAGVSLSAKRQTDKSATEALTREANQVPSMNTGLVDPQVSPGLRGLPVSEHVIQEESITNRHEQQASRGSGYIPPLTSELTYPLGFEGSAQLQQMPHDGMPILALQHPEFDEEFFDLLDSYSSRLGNTQNSFPI